MHSQSHVSGLGRLRAWMRGEVATLHPGSFALVMATGIVTLVMWTWATWIPFLVLFGIWKHGARRLPLRYMPMLWSLVFPLGMYGIASLRLSLAAELPGLKTLSAAMTWVALAAWIATALGLALPCRQRYQHFDRARPGAA
jgi:tellurite resistance protein TehA-like permease